LDCFEGPVSIALIGFEGFACFGISTLKSKALGGDFSRIGDFDLFASV
jgi:hypothetical protein